MALNLFPHQLMTRALFCSFIFTIHAIFHHYLSHPAKIKLNDPYRWHKLTLLHFFFTLISTIVIIYGIEYIGDTFLCENSVYSIWYRCQT